MTDLDPNEAMLEAIWTLPDRFLDSGLDDPDRLAQLGFVESEVSGGCHEWNGTGDFYGRANLWLKRPDGIQFSWRVGILFEQGENDGIFWQQGGAYSYVEIALDEQNSERVYYQLENVALPASPMAVADLIPFSEGIIKVSNECFEDLLFVCQDNRVEQLVVLALDRFALAEQRTQETYGTGLAAGQVYGTYDLYNWESNPLRSNHNA